MDLLNGLENLPDKEQNTLIFNNAQDNNDDYEKHKKMLMKEKFDIEEDPDISKNDAAVSRLSSTMRRIKERMIKKAEQEKDEHQKHPSAEKQQHDDDDGSVEDHKISVISHVTTQKEQPIFSETDDIFHIFSEAQSTHSGNLHKNSGNTNQNDHDDASDDDHEDEVIRHVKRKSRIREVVDDDDDEDGDGDGIIKSTQQIALQIPSENEDLDQNWPTQKIATSNTSSTQTDLNHLFDEEKKPAQDFSNDGDIISNIPGYDQMTREQKYLARKTERHRLRNLSRKEINELEIDKRMNAGSKEHNKTRRRRKDVMDLLKEEEKIKMEYVIHNEMMKESIKQLTKVEPTEFTKEKLLDVLHFESDDNTEEDYDIGLQKGTTASKQSQPLKMVKNAPRIKKISPHIKQDEETVDLSSSSENEDSEDDDNNKQLEKLDLKVKLSKKRKQYIEKISTLSFSDKIKNLNAQQIRLRHKNQSSDNKSQVKIEKDILSDDILAKMLLDEQLRNSKNLSKKLKQETRIQKMKERLKNGEFPSHDDDDPEFSSDGDNVSSNFEISEGEEGADEDGDEKENENEKELGDFKISATNETPGKTFTQLFDDPTQPVNNYEELSTFEKFQKLKSWNNGDDTNLQKDELPSPNITKSFSSNTNNESFFTKKLKEMENSDDDDINKKSIVEVNENILDSQNLILETQIDDQISTQQIIVENNDDNLKLSQLEYTSTQTVLDAALVDNNITLDEAKSYGGNDENENADADADSDADDDDDDDDEKIKLPKRLAVSENMDHSEVEADYDDEPEEIRAKRAELIKLAKKKEREITRQRELEFKSKGLGNIMENEAVESDDEYNGYGGVDKDFSEEENSEDEKIIDDESNIKIDESALRKKQIDDDLKKDEEQLKKTYNDIMNHNLSKRRAKDGFYDVDSSDDEAARDLDRMRRIIQKRKLKEANEIMNKNRVKISETDPKKAFYDSLAINLPSHISIYKESISSLSQMTSDDEHTTRDTFTEGSSKKRRKISKYSFENDDDFKFSSFKDAEDAKARRELLSENSDDDDIDDGTKELKLLKKKTSINKVSRKLKPSKYSARLTEEGDSADSLSILSNHSNSITSSFKKATEKKIKISKNTGNIIRDVTVTTSSKPVSNSKSTVTRLASGENVIPMGKNIKMKTDKFDKLLARSRNAGIKNYKKYS